MLGFTQSCLSCFSTFNYFFMYTSYNILKYNITITALQMTTAAMTTTMHRHHSNQQCEGGWANNYKHLPRHGMMTTMMIQTVQMMIRSHMCLWGVAKGFLPVEGKCCVVNRELFSIAIIDDLYCRLFFMHVRLI